MGQDNDLVPCDMNICFDSVCAHIYSSSKGGYGVLRILCPVASMGDRLGDIVTTLALEGASEGSCMINQSDICSATDGVLVPMCKCSSQANSASGPSGRMRTLGLEDGTVKKRGDVQEGKAASLGSCIGPTILSRPTGVKAVGTLMIRGR